MSAESPVTDVVNSELPAEALMPVGRPGRPGDDLLARNERRAAKAALYDALDSVLIGVWDYDLTTGRARRSMAHDQIHGYTEAVEEWTFDTFLSHVAPEHREDIRARFDRCLTTGSVEFDCPITRADGSSAWICSRGRLVRDAGGTPDRLVGIVMDVTGNDVRLVPARERRQNESVVSTLAHELRRPLATLLAAVELTRLSPQGGVADHVTDIMKRQIGQMNRVIEDVIAATRWSRGKVTVRKQRLDVRDLIRDAEQDIRVAAAETGHDLTVDPITEPSWIDADPERLRQALSTLLRNALKHTNPGGRISLRVDRGRSTITLRVADTGRGIEPDALSRVFELVSEAGRTESAGLSIDLNIVSRIVALHDGRIEARSEGLGHGSEFSITLPLVDPSSTAPPAAR